MEQVRERYLKIKNDKLRFEFCKKLCNFILKKYKNDKKTILAFYYNNCNYGLNEVVGLLIMNKIVDPGFYNSIGFLCTTQKGYLNITYNILTLKDYGSLNVSVFDNIAIRMMDWVIKICKCKKRCFSKYLGNKLLTLFIKHPTFSLNYTDPNFIKVCSIFIQYDNISIIKYFVQIPDHLKKKFFLGINFNPVNYINFIAYEKLFDLLLWTMNNYNIKNISQISNILIRENRLDIFSYGVYLGIIKPNYYNGIALRIATEINKPEIVKYLLQFSINTVSVNNTPFINAVSHGNIEIMDLLYKHNPKIKELVLDQQERIMERAGMTGNCYVVRYLFDKFQFRNPKDRLIMKMIRSRKRKAENNDVLVEFCKNPKVRRIIDKTIEPRYRKTLMRVYSNVITQEMSRIKMLHSIVNTESFWRGISKDLRVTIVKMVWDEHVSMDKFLISNLKKSF